MPRYTTQSGSTITTDKKLGAGGEGTVYTIVGQPHSVAKIYHAQRLNQALADKVHAMVADPPDDDTRNNPQLNHVSIAWPEQVLFSGGKFVGYVMPKIPKADDLYDLLQPQQRAKQHPHANHRTIYRTARNFATAMAAIHRKNYVIGDVNFKNALFADNALITIVDCDSMQVTDARGTVHRCLVGLPEYTAPELQGADFNTVNRTPNTDTFGLAVLIFQLLMQGFHPFAGRPLPGAPDVEQVHVYCITRNIFPYEQNTLFEPPKAAPPITAIPGVLRTMFQRAFTEKNRPSAQEWGSVLEMVERRLIQCGNDAEHWYPADGACVICEVEFNAGRRKRTTTTSQSSQMQVPLPTRNNPVATPPAPVTQPVVNPTPAPPFRIPPTVPPQPRNTASMPAGASTRTVWSRWGQQRTTLVAIAVIVTSLLIMLFSWSQSTTPTPVAVPTTIRPADIVEPNEVPRATATAELAPSATVQRVVLPACTQEALLSTAFPAYPSLYAKMKLDDWPTTLTTYFGNELQPTAIPDTSKRALLTTSLSNALQCGDGQLQRFGVDDPQRGSGMNCTDADCGDVQPLFREYQSVIYGENTPSRDNYGFGKAILARFFAKPGSNARYTVLIFDAEQSAYKLFTKYQLPIVQHEFTIARDKDLRMIVATDTSTWYDVARGIQTVPTTAMLEHVQRTISIPTTLQWRDGTPVQANDYVRWFAGCDSRPVDVAPCHYIAAVVALNQQQLAVTYYPGVPKELAKIIQPYALPPRAARSDITDVATMLRDSMGIWECDSQLVDNTWQCTTVPDTSSSDTKVAVFYLYQSDLDMVETMENTFDIAIASADFSPEFADVINYIDFIAPAINQDYTVEFVPTGAFYAVARN